MSAIRNLKRFADASQESGDEWYSTILKTSMTSIGTANNWQDASMAPGIPKYNNYVGNQATATLMLSGGNNGIYLGPSPATGKDKYINQITYHSVGTALPLYMLLCDYLMFYPLIDGDSTDLQAMDNPVSLPRYTTGEGVMATVVAQVASNATNPTVVISYTNSSGVPGRVSTFTLKQSTNIGHIVSTNVVASGVLSAPFIPLASGDKGIRSIESVQLTSGAGYGGFMALVLLKPLCSVVYPNNTVPVEHNYLKDMTKAVKVEEGAYLNFILLNGSSTPGINAMIHTINL